MRAGLRRRLGLGTLLTAAVAGGAAAQLPPVDRKSAVPVPSLPAPDARYARAELQPPAPADDALSAERARLQAQLLELLKRINERPAAPPTPRPPAPPPRPKFDPPDGTRPLDSMRLAMNLFRDNDIDAALRAFRLIDPTQLTREDRAFVQYMTACCLRRLNRRAEAAAVYREVADIREDEFVADCAVWQVALIRSTQELEAQLEQLRSRPKSR